MDFKNSLLASTSFIPIPNDIEANIRAKSLLVSTVDNFLSADNSNQLTGYVGNYLEVYTNTFIFQYNFIASDNNAYFSFVSSSQPSNIQSSAYLYNVQYSNYEFDFVIYDNYAFTNGELIEFTLQKTAYDITYSKVCSTIISNISVSKYAADDIITINYISDVQYAIVSNEYGNLGIAQLNIQFNNPIVSFLLTADQIPTSEDRIAFNIGIVANFVIPTLANTFSIFNISNVYYPAFVNPDKISFTLPDARLNQIIPIFNYFDSNNNIVTSTYSNIINKLSNSNVSTDNYAEWGQIYGFNYNPPITNDKFINYGKYYWIGNLLPTINSVEYNNITDVYTPLDNVRWLDIRELSNSIYKITIHNEDEIITLSLLTAIADYWGYQGLAYKQYIVSNKSQNNFLVDLNPYDIVLDSYNNEVYTVDDKILIIAVMSDDSIINCIFQNTINTNVPSNTIYYSMNSASTALYNLTLNSGFFADEIYLTSILLVPNILAEYPALAIKKSYNSTCQPQYYTIKRDDLDSVNPYANDWQQDNYWISADVIVNHSNIYGYDYTLAIQAKYPIIEFDDLLQLNSYFDPTTNLASDHGVFYIQYKILFNQAPDYDLYYLNSQYYSAYGIILYDADDNTTINSDLQLPIEYVNINGNETILFFTSTIGDSVYTYKLNNNDTLIYNYPINYIPQFFSIDEFNKATLSTDYNSVDGAWQIADPVSFNLQHATTDTITFTNLKQNLLDLQFANLGTIRDYNIGFDYLVSLMNNNSFDLVIVTNYIKNQYNSIYAKAQEYILSYFINTASSANFSDLYIDLTTNSISSNYIYKAFLNYLMMYNNQLFNDSFQFSGLPLTLPMLGFCETTIPQIVYDNIINDYTILCHDGHKIPYFNFTASNNIIDLLFTRFDGSINTGITASTVPTKMYKNQLWLCTNSFGMYTIGSTYIFAVISDNCTYSYYQPASNSYKYWISGVNNMIYAYNTVSKSYNIPVNADGTTAIGYYFDYNGANNNGICTLVILTLDDHAKPKMTSFGQNIAPAIIRFDVEQLINTAILLNLETNLYNSVPNVEYNGVNIFLKNIGYQNSVDNIDYMSADSIDILLIKMQDAFNDYCISNSLNPNLTDFTPENAFTWNYSQANLSIDSEVCSFARWYDMYMYVYGTTQPNTQPWILVNQTETIFLANLASSNITPFTYSMWQYVIANYTQLRINNNIVLPIDFNTNVLLTPYINTKYNPQYISNTIINTIPNGISEIYQFGQNGPVEYIWRISTDYKYDYFKALYQTLPIPIIKIYLGYDICSVIQNSYNYEYHKCVSRKLQPTEYYLYGATNTFEQNTSIVILQHSTQEYIFNVYSNIFVDYTSFTITVFEVTDNFNNFICYARNDPNTLSNGSNIYFFNSDGSTYTGSAILPLLFIDDTPYGYFIGAQLIIGVDVSFNNAINLYNNGFIQWMTYYMRATNQISNSTILNSINAWNVSYGFRTNGVMNSNNLQLSVGNNTLEDTQYDLLEYTELSNKSYKISGITVSINKIGRATINGSNFIPYGNGDDWIFNVSNVNPYDTLDFYTLNDNGNFDTINIQNNIFMLYNIPTNNIFRLSNTIIYGLQNLTTFIYGINLYYSQANITCNNDSYFIQLNALLNSIYTTGANANSTYYLNPFTQNIAVDTDIGLASIFNAPSQSSYYLQSYISGNQNQLLNVDTDVSIMRHQNITNIFSINSNNPMAYGRILYNIWDSIVVFKNTTNYTIFDAFSGVIPSAVRIEAFRSNFTGRPDPSGYYLSQNNILTNIESNITLHENMFNIYSKESPFKSAMYSLIGYTNNQLFASLGLSESNEFRLFKDGHRYQGTNSILNTVFSDSTLLGTTYQAVETYIILLGEYGSSKIIETNVNIPFQTKYSYVTFDLLELTAK